MDIKDHRPTQAEIDKYSARGYNADLLPKGEASRTMGRSNYFTLWMGSIHNVPNYAAVGGFLFLGLSPINVMAAICISALLVAALLIFNGVAGSKYGIPFALQLRSTYGEAGAKLPGFLRGCVAAIAWFGLQTYTGSLALMILIGKLFPGFLEIGQGISFFGIGVPGLISFAIFWVVNVLIGFGGGSILNKFTAVLSPLIYVLVIGMTGWAIVGAGGLGPILSFSASAETSSINPVFVYFMIFNSVLGVWAAPGASVSDFTQNAKSTKDQAIGQGAGLIVGYVVFAFCSVAILIGGSIIYGVEEWDILSLISRWSSIPAVVFATAMFLLTTISTNATGNIIPAAYQLTALFPKKINYRRGVLIASVIAFLIMPWKLMENSASIYGFLNLIGAVLGPVTGCMIANFYLVHRRVINLDQLYFDSKSNTKNTLYAGLNKPAYAATIIAVLISISGQFIPALSSMSSVSWFIGFLSSALLYVLFKRLSSGGDMDRFPEEGEA